MDNQLFNLKFTSKQLLRQSKKSTANVKKQESKCKRAMEKGDRDGARIYAEGAIREKNQALNYLRLSARIDGVAQRVQTAVSMNMLTKSMGGVVKSMDAAMQSMDAEAISGVMDKFEKQFEDLDISTQFMENSMQSSTVQTMPVSQVDELMMKVADEHGLEFDAAMRDPSLKSTVNRSEEAKVEEKKEVSPEEALEARLRALQGL